MARQVLLLATVLGMVSGCYLDRGGRGRESVVGDDPSLSVLGAPTAEDIAAMNGGSDGYGAWECMSTGLLEEECKSTSPRLPAPPPRAPLPAGSTCSEIDEEAPLITTRIYDATAMPTCLGDDKSGYFSLADGAEELHVVSILEGDYRSMHFGASPSAQPRGSVRVVVKATDRPAVLALHASEPTDWEIITAEGARLARVHLIGLGHQRITGRLPHGVPVIEAEGCHCAYGFEPAYNADGCNFRGALTQIRAETGLYESSFQGCAQAAELIVPPPAAP